MLRERLLPYLSFPPPFFGPMAGLGTPFAPHIVGVFQQFGKAQDSQKRREILGCNLVKGDLHLVAELVNHPLFVAAQLHGPVKLFFHLRERGLRVGGGAVGGMGLTDIPEDAVKVVMNRVAEKVALLHLAQLQSADIQVILSRPVAAEHLLPGGLQNEIHLGNPHVRDPVHENLNVGHQPLEILMGGHLTQQPVVDLPAAQQCNHIITQMQSLKLCVWVIFLFRQSQQIIGGHPIKFRPATLRQSAARFNGYILLLKIGKLICIGKNEPSILIAKGIKKRSCI